VFPARSICRTRTALAAYVPALNVNVLPLPVVHVVPLLVLYSHVAFDSRPVTVTVPLLVTPSELLLPVSVSVAVGALDALWSTVIPLTSPVLSVFPARSICRTRTALAAYVPALKVNVLPLPVVQLVPALVLYSHVALDSRPVTVTVPSLVMPSEPLLPVS